MAVVAGSYLSRPRCGLRAIKAIRAGVDHDRPTSQVAGSLEGLTGWSGDPARQRAHLRLGSWRGRRPAPQATLPCRDRAGVWWVGKLRGGGAGLQAWLSAQPGLRDETSRHRRVMRLAREAGEAYADALRSAVWVTVTPDKP